MLILADVRTWAWHRKAEALAENLSDRFAIDVAYSTESETRGILLDGTTQGGGNPRLLLQIFSQPAIGPVFFEFIQRKKDEGFGEGNFTALFDPKNQHDRPFNQWVINTVVIASINAAASVFISALAAYAFSRLEFRGRGRLTLADLERRLEQAASEIDVQLDFFQSNHEGGLIDAIQGEFAGNAGALEMHDFAIP